MKGISLKSDKKCIHQLCSFNFQKPTKKLPDQRRRLGSSKSRIEAPMTNQRRRVTKRVGNCGSHDAGGGGGGEGHPDLDDIARATRAQAEAAINKCERVRRIKTDLGIAIKFAWP